MLSKFPVCSSQAKIKESLAKALAIIEDVSVQNCVEEEVQDTLTLNETKVKKSTYIKLALQNVISTPKKNNFYNHCLYGYCLYCPYIIFNDDTNFL